MYGDGNRKGTGYGFGKGTWIWKSIINLEMKLGLEIKNWLRSRSRNSFKHGAGNRNKERSWR